MPFGLCREWTQDAYEEVVKRRPWNFTRVYGILSVPASRTVTCTLTLDSATVTALAGVFTGADIGRQLRLAGVTLPVYTIQTVAAGGASCTLDVAWADASNTGSQSCTVIQLYQTLPADFGAFLLVIDTSNQRLVPWWHTQEDLARVDPTRTSTDANPRVLVSRSLSTAPSTLGQVQYEWWPGPTTARQFPYYYRRQAQQLADDDALLGVLTSRVLVAGALASCAAWPGTPEQKNPYFNLGLHAKLQDEFDEQCAALELRDDDQNQETWSTLPYHRWPLWDLTGDTAYLRSTDATLNAYY